LLSGTNTRNLPNPSITADRLKTRRRQCPFYLCGSNTYQGNSKLKAVLTLHLKAKKKKKNATAAGCNPHVYAHMDLLSFYKKVQHFYQ